MLQEVEESTATLLPMAEQVGLELEEEARANWEERAVYNATQVTYLAGEAFETLSENRWSRRDCREYQKELDWVMRTFRRVYNEIDIASMPVKMCRVACPASIASTTSISGPQGSWRDFFRHTEDARRRGVRRPVVVMGRADVSGRLQRRARTRPEDGVRGLHPHGKATDLAGDGDPGCGTAGAVLGERTDGEMVSPQRSRQGPRNL
jgi:hypothetical protein